MRYLSLIALFLLFIYSCKEEDEESLPTNFEGYTYYPLNIGDTWTYDVDSIVYDDFTQTIDTFSFQIRELIESTFIDGAGRKNYKINVSTRSTDTLSWRFNRTISKLRIDLRAENLDNNITTVPLVFPAIATAEWDVNILNTQEEILCNYERLHLAFEGYDSTITVVQEPDISLINRNTSKEVYASNIGLVFVQKEDLQLDFSSGEIESGFILTKRLISYN